MMPILGWVWLVAREPVLSVADGSLPRFLARGSLFSEPFNTVHAGFVMDQPTIGKWLFWFSFMAASSLPYAAAVGWLSDRRSRGARLVFGLATGMVCLALLCILSWPICWLIQYVWSMGCTPKRIFGLLFALAGGLLVTGFLTWAVRKPHSGVSGY
jgi:hypothetical protein